VDDVTAEKIARNNSVFRDANEQIADAAVEHGLGDERTIPMICECSKPRCTELIRITLDDYRRVREDPRRFVHAHGHEPEIAGAVRTVEHHDDYIVVEKVGHAGQVASELASDAASD
jgi:hypothetical protein